MLPTLYRRIIPSAWSLSLATITVDDRRIVVRRKRWISPTCVVQGPVIYHSRQHGRDAGKWALHGRCHPRFCQRECVMLDSFHRYTVINPITGLIKAQLPFISRKLPLRPFSSVGSSPATMRSRREIPKDISPRGSSIQITSHPIPSRPLPRTAFHLCFFDFFEPFLIFRLCRSPRLFGSRKVLLSDLCIVSSVFVHYSYIRD